MRDARLQFPKDTSARNDDALRVIVLVLAAVALSTACVALGIVVRMPGAFTFAALTH